MKAKYYGKKLISFILSLVIVISTFTVSGISVYADENEASIGSTSYATLEEAFASAKNGDVITLLTNASISSTIEITKNLTLRAEGSATVTRDQGFEGVMINTSSSFTLMGVTVDGGGVGSSALITVSGTLTMRDGSAVTGGAADGVRVEGGSFNFYGGTIYGNGMGIRLADDVSSLNLSGSATIGEGDGIYMPSSVCIGITGDLTGSGTIAVHTDSAYVNQLVASCSVSLSADQVSRFKVYEDDTEYVCTYTNNGIYVDKPLANFNEARIGDETYKTLTEAFVAAASGDRVTLIGDAVISEPVSVDKNITLDAEGNYTVILKAPLTVEKGAALNVSDDNNTLILSGSGTDTGVAMLDVRGNLTLGSNVTVTGITNSTEASTKGAVLVQGTLTLSGGNISGNRAKTAAIYVDGGSLVMNGGSINNNTAASAVHIASGSFELGGGSVYGNSGEGVWSAGSFTLSGNGSVFSSSSYSGTVYLDGDAKVKVAEGWAPADAPAGYTNIIPLAASDMQLTRVMAEFTGNAVSDYFKVSVRYEGQFALLAKDKTLVVAAADEVYCVYWGNNPYMTIEEAIAALPMGSSVTLKIVGDVTVSATAVIPMGMNIVITTDVNPASLADYTTRTVKRAEGFAESIFSVSKGSTLTLEAAEGKTLVFDGDGKAASRAMVTVAGTFSLGKGVTLQGNHNKAAEVIGQNSVLTFGGGVYVEAGASFVLSGGVIKNNYASYGGGVYVNDGVMSIAEGELTANNAIYGGGIYLESTGATAEVFASLTMTGGVIHANTATANETLADSGAAGGVYIGNGSLFVMSAGELKANTAAYGGAVCVGTASAGEDVPEPQIQLSGTANINSDNSIYLCQSGFSRIIVTGDLTGQKGTMTLSIPSTMPQNMELVRFIYGDKVEKNEAAALSAFNKPLFALDKAASEYFTVSISPVDKSVLINTAGEVVPTRAKSGEHYNGLDRYEEGDGEAEEGETKTEIVYDPVIIREKGRFTAYYEMSYYTNLYKNVNTHISAPFPIGTRVVLVDYSDEENIGYYYYEVSGEEPVIEQAEVKDGVKTPDIIEIPLTNFHRMGAKDSFYEAAVSEDKSEKAVTIEKLLITVDFVDVKAEEGVTLEGEFAMKVCNTYPGAVEGQRVDISSNLLSASYTVSNTTTSTLTLTGEDNKFNVNYELTSDSAALAANSGVILFQIGYGTFPRGSVITDAEGNQYPAADNATVIAVPMPKDGDGKLISKGSAEYTLTNYYGTALVNASLRCVVAVSDDGLHYRVGSDYDAQSEGVKFELSATDDYSILVATLDGEKKPFYEDYESLVKSKALRMNVSGLINTEEATTFNLSLLKKDGKEYVPCLLSELFNVGSDFGYEVVLNTGELSLDLTSDLDYIKGNEYKVAFKIGDAVEYVKVNVIEKK